MEDWRSPLEGRGSVFAPWILRRRLIAAALLVFLPGAATKLTAQTDADRRVAVSRFQAFKSSEDAAIADNIHKSLKDELGKSGFPLVDFPSLAPRAAVERARAEKAPVLISGFYSVDQGVLVLYGQIYDARKGVLIDAFNLSDEMADLEELLQKKGTYRTSTDALIRRFAERLALRARTNPNLRVRRENLDEFVYGAPIASRIDLPQQETTEEKAGSSDVFKIMEEQVVVSGTKTELKLREVPATIRVVTEDDIRRHGYQFLEEVLRDQPGFDIIYMRGLYGPIFMQRGLDQPENLRTLVFIDGALDNSISSGSAYIKPKYSLHNVKRIEILYGPASSLYGANAFTGIINIITKDGGDIKNYMEYSVGSYYYEPDFHRPGPNASVTVGRKFGTEPDAPAISVAAFWIDTLGPVINRRDNQDPKKSTYFWNDGNTAAAQRDNGTVQIKGQWKGFEVGGYRSRDYTGQGSFASSAAVSDNSTINFWNQQNTAAYAKYQTDIGTWGREQIQVTYRETHIKDGSDADLNTFGDMAGPITIVRYKRPDSEISADNPFMFKWSSTMNTIVGASYSRQNSLNYNTNSVLYPGGQTAVLLYGMPQPPQVDSKNLFAVTNRAGYLQHYWRFLESTSVTLGYRYDYFNIEGKDGPQFCGTDERTLSDGTANPNFISVADANAGGCEFIASRRQYYSHKPADKTYFADNPRIGFVYSPSSRTSAKVLYGEAFRAPTIREFYSTAGSRVTNADLRPEKVRTFEVGGSFYPVPEVRTEASAYVNYVEDMIFLAGTTIHRAGRSATSYYTRFQNAGKAQVLGSEMTVEAAPAQWLRLYIGYTYQQSKLFDVIDPSLLAHDDVPDEGAKINQTNVCRAALTSIRQSAIIGICGGYRGNMPRVAKNKLNLGTNFLFFKHLNLDFRMNYVDTRTNIATNPAQSVPPYFLVSSTLGSKDWPFQGMDIAIKIFNVFDQKILDPGYRDARGDYYPTAHPLPGRYVGFLITHRL